MKKFFIFLLVFAVFFLFGCGNKKSDEKESVKNDTDSEIFDEEKNDKPDNDPENGEILEPDDDPENGETLEPDDDPEYPDEGGVGGSCSNTVDYGSASFKRDENFFDQCVYEAEHSYDCYGRNSEFDAKELFENLRKLKIVFNKKDCHQEPYGQIPCPDYIPNSITLSNAQLTGCRISVGINEPGVDFDCLLDCPTFYFSTDNENFKTIYFQHDYYYPYDGKPFYYSSHFGSNNEELGVSLYISYAESDYDAASFHNYKAGDKYSVKLLFKIIVDGIPQEEDEDDFSEYYKKCTDFDGISRKHGERITYDCRQFTCNSGEWDKDFSMCYASCQPDSTAKWLCNDNQTEIDWCECFGDEETESKWSCIDRTEENCHE